MDKALMEFFEGKLEMTREDLTPTDSELYAETLVEDIKDVVRVLLELGEDAWKIRDMLDTMRETLEHQKTQIEEREKNKTKQVDEEWDAA